MTWGNVETIFSIGGCNVTKSITQQMRASTHINRRVTQSIFRACDYAQAIGRPLNTYIVIRLHETDAACAATLFKRIRHKFRDWLQYNSKAAGLPATSPDYIFAFENPAETQPHVNWAVHVPPILQAQFERKVKQWVKRTHGHLGDYDVDAQPIRASHLKRLAKYIVKGTDPAFIEHFYLQEVHAPQGTFHGKRAGISPSLGPSARRAAQFRPRRGRHHQWPHPVAAGAA